GENVGDGRLFLGAQVGDEVSACVRGDTVIVGSQCIGVGNRRRDVTCVGRIRHIRHHARAVHGEEVVAGTAVQVDALLMHFVESGAQAHGETPQVVLGVVQYVLAILDQAAE